MFPARLAVAALSAAAFSTAVCAGERYGRLTVDVLIDGPGQSRAGPDHATYVTAQSVHMAFTLLASSAGDAIHYSPTNACNGEFAATIDDSVAGLFVDGGEMRQFAGRTTARVKGDALQVSTMCRGTVTIDRAGKLSARLALPRIDGHVVNTEAGRVVYASRSEVLIDQQAWKWAVAQLQGAARGGVQRTVLKVPAGGTMGGKGEHQLNVQVRWAFAPK
ncbi:hypothetical protein IP92_03805 [Pseudoduganella flava]|uniref:Uncharacterized protein n=1 Tax=Pseudoduganella flava TaxID=871742 RepID=A0A562PLX6_9BURK|nr:hypothetical protein [Pseudoduganella flava]QGZ40898.1 hypothetical protein GO485_18695 [Pseudoduganella flava]TWI45427.1 hypothetical protein IP92_03805 [Pseudoduganella flava]